MGNEAAPSIIKKDSKSVVVESPWDYTTSYPRKRMAYDKAGGFDYYQMVYTAPKTSKEDFRYRRHPSKGKVYKLENVKVVLYFDYDAKHGIAGKNFYALRRNDVKSDTSFILYDTEDKGIEIKQKGKVWDAKKAWIFTPSELNYKDKNNVVTFAGSTGKIYVKAIASNDLLKYRNQGLIANENGREYVKGFAKPDNQNGLTFGFGDKDRYVLDLFNHGALVFKK